MDDNKLSLIFAVALMTGFFAIEAILLGYIIFGKY